jgi:hypothetical protein
VGRDEQMSWNQPEKLTKKVSSDMGLDQQMQLTEEEDSCGFPSHVNEYDDNLKTCTIQEEDQTNLLIWRN